MIRQIIQKQKTKRHHAQAMVEFAIILPLLVVLVLGILEIGRIVFIYAAVTNASREASRFGSAIGFEDNTYNLKYRYCSAIRERAKRTSFMVALQDTDITVEYDHGPSTTVFDTCPVGVEEDKTVVVKPGQDRVIITITTSYSPVTQLLPIGTRPITASSARTILGYAKITYP